MDCKKLAAAALILAAFTSGAGFAQESATLKKIKDSGTINLGHRESSIPFSYYNDQQQVIGYSQELMLKVVDAIRDNLKRRGVRSKRAKAIAAATWNKQHPDDPNPWLRERKRKGRRRR